MSDIPFPHIDTSFSALDVFVSDPSNPFNVPENTPGSHDTSPIESLPSTWNTQPFSPTSLLDGPWAQVPSQSSAQQFWTRSQNTFPRPQGDFDANNHMLSSNFDVQQAMIDIAASATPSRKPSLSSSEF
jgi:hypothetical protein